MKKSITLVLVFLILLTGCDQRIKPIKVTRTDFDMNEAAVIMKRAWKPVHDMTNTNYETRPNIPIASKEELLNIYDFNFMDEKYMVNSIYETIVDFDSNGEVRDNNRNLVFGENNIVSYIPTIYDKGVVIKEAYLQESKYKEEYSIFDRVELIVREISDDQVNLHAKNFSRKNTFIKNENGDWILYSIEGTISFSWQR